MTYLDAAATTLQKPAAVAQAAARAISVLGSPGRGGHEAAMRAAETAYTCRELAAQLFHVPVPEQVVFCMNATHGLNLAIKSIVRPGDRVAISGYEHNAVLRPLNGLGAELLIAKAPLFCPTESLAAFERVLRPGIRVCIVNHVSNVFGSIQPLSEIAQLCRSRGIPLIVDASQSAGVLDLDLQALGAAFIACPGHKGLYGPQGTGLLLCAHDAKPLLEGGSGSDSQNPLMPDALPDRLEAGTHNMPGIAGLLEGLRFVKRLGTDAILRHERTLREQASAMLAEDPRVRIYRAEKTEAQTGVMSFQVAGMDCEEAARRLSERGFALRAGLHCAPLAHRSVGSEGTVRMSFSVFNRPREVRRLAAAVRML